MDGGDVTREGFPFWRMPSSGMLRCVALVRTDVSEKLSASIIRVTRISEQGTTLAVTSNRRTLRSNTMYIVFVTVFHFLFLRSVRRLLVTANVVARSQILVALMMKGLSSSETSVLTRATQRNVPKDAILHSHLRENLKSYITLTAWTLYRRRNVSPVRYDLGVYIPEDDILHSHRRENLKSYIALTGWTL
jgi:hypothetical protein